MNENAKSAIAVPFGMSACVASDLIPCSPSRASCWWRFGVALTLAHALEFRASCGCRRKTHLAVQAIYYPCFTVGAVFGEVPMLATLAGPEQRTGWAARRFFSPHRDGRGQAGL